MNRYAPLLMFFTACCSSAVVAQDNARTARSTAGSIPRAEQGGETDQGWKPYRNIRDQCGGIEATIVTITNAKILQARKHNEDIDRIRQSGGDAKKLVEETLSSQESWDRLISDEARIWSQLGCATILYPNP